MKRAIVSLALIAGLLFGSAAPAQAAPTYGSRFTLRHGWIVKVHNDGRWSRVHCEWYARGGRWTLTWRMYPYENSWTTSDAGNWGDTRPQGLDCTYRRI